MARANKGTCRLWRLSQIKIGDVCLLTLYKSLVRPQFRYAKACWIDQSNSNINNVQLNQNSALGIFMGKRRWQSVKKLHEEANITDIRGIQIRLAKENPKSAKENKIESILELLQKKRQRPKNSYQCTLYHLFCYYFLNLTPTRLSYVLITIEHSSTTSKYIAQGVNSFGTERMKQWKMVRVRATACILFVFFICFI